MLCHKYARIFAKGELQIASQGIFVLWSIVRWDFKGTRLIYLIETELKKG